MLPSEHANVVVCFLTPAFSLHVMMMLEKRSRDASVFPNLIKELLISVRISVDKAPFVCACVGM